VIASLWGADRRAACCGAGWEPAWVAVWRSWGLAAGPGGRRWTPGRCGACTSRASSSPPTPAIHRR